MANEQPLQMPVPDQTENIWKALRLVPEFDGNSNVLIRFLDICDQLILKYVDPAPGNDLNNSALLNGILNKITGHAAKTLATNGIPQDWNGIRNALINSFSDHRDESALYTDMSMLSQGSDTPQIFYERVQNLLSIIITYVQLHERVSTTVEAKRELYKKLALQTYTRGLAEPLGSRVRCMRPDSLQKALEFAQEELNVIYLQNKSSAPNSKKPANYSQFNYSPFNSHELPASSRQFNYVFPMRPVRPNNFPNNFVPNNFAPNNSFAPNSHYPYSGFRPTQGHQNFIRQQGPSRTQQMMRALPTNMSTGFKIPPRNNFPQNYRNFPTPMSGVSHPVARALPPTHQNTRPQINFNEHFVDPDTYDLQSDYDQQAYMIMPEPDSYYQPDDMTDSHEQQNFLQAPDQISPE